MLAGLGTVSRHRKAQKSATGQGQGERRQQGRGDLSGAFPRARNGRYGLRR
jgi:hypothetical protein